MRRLTVSSIIMLLAVACGGGSAADTTTADVPTTNQATTSPPATVGSPLVGTWERAEGDFSELIGMVVEVQGDGGSAVIVTVPENPYQFVVGDVKWDQIEASDDGGFTFQDLVRQENTGATSTVEGVITLSDDANTIEITFPDTGTVQEWVRSDG